MVKLFAPRLHVFDNHTQRKSLSTTQWHTRSDEEIVNDSKWLCYVGCIFNKKNLTSLKKYHKQCLSRYGYINLHVIMH